MSFKGLRCSMLAHLNRRKHPDTHNSDHKLGYPKPSSSIPMRCVLFQRLLPVITANVLQIATFAHLVFQMFDRQQSLYYIRIKYRSKITINTSSVNHWIFCTRWWRWLRGSGKCKKNKRPSEEHIQVNVCAPEVISGKCIKEKKWPLKPEARRATSGLRENETMTPFFFLSSHVSFYGARPSAHNRKLKKTNKKYARTSLRRARPTSYIGYIGFFFFPIWSTKQHQLHFLWMCCRFSVCLSSVCWSLSSVTFGG